jgi:hypothetical protein
MFRPVRSNTNGFDASSSGDLTLLPPTTLTEAFVAAHTEVLCQLLQAQQRMAQQQQMPPSNRRSNLPSPVHPKYLPRVTSTPLSAPLNCWKGRIPCSTRWCTITSKDVMGNHLKIVRQTVSLSPYLPLWLNKPGCSICWRSMLIKTNPRSPTPYYHLLDYQWILEKKRGQIEATNEYYRR